LEICTHAT
jgi:hypothetical protein